ncbi:MAG: 4Fe-4S dicluster domain-containing protein, partial [Deltaproteobacteria bacterium]|nr:4Fe-4S dicluster domain-containing protein [Deltaproteobacteria bacterium]
MSPDKLTIDGMELQYRPGESILDHARRQGIHIPTLCHIAPLSPLGSCRICIVEDASRGRMVASCVTPAAAGMVIDTRSARVLRTRRNILRLILASHPEACVVCDKGNRCALRERAAELGVGTTGLDRIALPPRQGDPNPHIQRDLSKCIMCGRCTRACHELVVEGVVDYHRRGFAAQPATPFDLPLRDTDCTGCGTCVILCPTGALKEKGRAYQKTVGRVAPAICPHCSCGCPLELELKDSTLVGVRNNGLDEDHQPALCLLGRYGIDFVASSERLRAPRIRKQGELHECSWEEALDFVAAGLSAVREQHSPAALAVLGSGRSSCEESYLLQKLARTALGTNNIDLQGRGLLVQDEAGPSRGSMVLDRTASPFSTLGDCDVLLVVGADPTQEAPALGYALKRAVRLGGARLILGELCRNPLTRLSTLALPAHPGTEGLLLAGLAIALAEDDLRRMGKSVEVSAALDIFQYLSPDFGLSEVVARTGVPAAELAEAAELLFDAEHVGIVYGPRLVEHIDAGANLRALLLLVEALRTLAKVRVSLFVSGLEVGTRGACRMGLLPAHLPGYRPVACTGSRAQLESLWRAELPPWPGLSLAQMGAAPGRIKGLLAVTADPLAELVSRAGGVLPPGSLEFLALVDVFDGELTRLAHAVLPAAAFCEKEGTFTAGDGTVRRQDAVLAPPGLARAETWIFGQLAERLGRPLQTELGAVRREIATLVPEYAPWTQTERSFVLGPSLAGETKDLSLRLEELAPAPLRQPQERGSPIVRGPGLLALPGGSLVGRTRRLSRGWVDGWPEPALAEARRRAWCDDEAAEPCSCGGAAGPT